MPRIITVTIKNNNNDELTFDMALDPKPLPLIGAGWNTGDGLGVRYLGINMPANMTASWTSGGYNFQGGCEIAPWRFNFYSNNPIFSTGGISNTMGMMNFAKAEYNAVNNIWRMMPFTYTVANGTNWVGQTFPAPWPGSFSFAHPDAWFKNYESFDFASSAPKEIKYLAVNFDNSFNASSCVG